jgi:hypothetical protein
MAQNQVSKTVRRMKIDYTSQVPVWTLAFCDEQSLKAVLLKGGMTAEAVRSGYGYKIQQPFRATPLDWIDLGAGIIEAHETPALLKSSGGP